MSQSAQKLTSVDETRSVVVPIRKNQRELGSDSTPGYAWDAYFSREMVESHMKSILDGLVLDAFIKDRFQNLGNSDNPFDAIYISELRPDPVSSAEIEKITAHREISDLSGTIEFTDFWED